MSKNLSNEDDTSLFIRYLIPSQNLPKISGFSILTVVVQESTIILHELFQNKFA